MPYRICLISLGCAKNQVNSEQMLYLLNQAGHEVVGEVDGCDVAIVNTCGFIDSAKSEAIDQILQLAEVKKAGGLKKILVTGCLSQRYEKDILESLPEVDGMLGTGSFGQICAAVEDVMHDGKPLYFGDKSGPIEEIGRVVTTGPGWAYLRIAEGCDNWCAFCAIPAIRGRYRSRTLDAIVQEAERRSIPLCAVSDFAAVAGGGVQAVQDGKTLYAGNDRYMESIGADTAALRAAAEMLAAAGKTPLYFAEGQHLLGVIAVADVVKPDSAAAIAALRRSGCEVVLLTGDNQRTAEAIARQVGVDRVIAQVLPQDKARCIEDLQKAGRLVAMVGDGVNDAPALVTADVGLAIGAGTDVAIESADVVLMRSSLMDIVDAAALSRATLRNIRQNLFWAFFYNSIGIPVAAGVLYPALGITLNPMIAAAAMSLSSVCVVSNALRLRGWKGSAPVRRGETPANTQSEPAAPAAQHNEEELTMKKTLSIEGMMCAHCAAHVEKALNALPGVTASVDLAGSSAVVTGDVSDEALKKAVADAGYTVTDIH